MPFDLIIIHIIVFAIAIIWDVVIYTYYSPKSFWSTFCWIICTLLIAFLLFFFTLIFVGLLSAGSFVNDFCYLSIVIGGITIVLFLCSALLIITLRNKHSKQPTDNTTATFFDILDELLGD